MLFAGMNCGWFRSIRIRSASAPSRITPSSPSRPMAFAPLAVAIFSTSAASTHGHFRFAPLYTSAAAFISWNIFRALLLPQPSVPRHTLIPASRNSGTGAKPFPSFMLLLGLMATLTCFSAMIRISSAVAYTQWAAITGTSNTPRESTYRIGVVPCSFSMPSISPRLSARWIVWPMPRSLQDFVSFCR